MTVLARVWCTFIVLFVYTILAVFIVPHVGKSLAFSKFYNTAHSTDVAKNLAVNENRVKEAKRALKDFHSQYEHYSSHFLNSSVKQPEFCFVVVTVSRPAHMQFLTQVVAALVPQIVNTNSIFMVYNAEGSTHKEAMNLSEIVPVETSTKHSAIRSKFVKEKEDYISALEWCFSKNTRYSVIFEDDALPPKYFMERLKFILKHRMSADSRSWAFLKLYYQEKWEGWSNEWRIILELIFTTTLGSVILTAFSCIIHYAVKRTPLSTINACVILFFSFLFVLYALLTLGRPHWLALRNISPHLSSVVPAPGSSTVAILYPQAHLSNIISYLKKSKSSHVDLVLDSFAEDSRLEELLVVPNLVKHIGFVSSLGKGWRNPIEFRI